MTPQQLALLAKAKRSLSGAKLLLANDLNEQAASRAYYSMFYITSAFLLDKGLSFSRHSAVIGAFGREFARKSQEFREFHKGIVNAQDLRTRSDYDLDSDVSIADVEKQIAIAEKFIAFFESKN